MSLIHCIAMMAILVTAPDLVTAQDRTPVEFTKDSLQVVKENVAKKNAVLVDVRSQKEWDKGHIEGSIFLPVDSLGKNVDPKVLAKKLPNDKILYTFCVVGKRAKTAANVLQQHGYTVRALEPGYNELIAAGFKKAQTEPSKAAARNEDSRQRNAG